MVTLQLLPFSEIEGLTSVGRIRKILNLAKENKIVIIQGKLRKDEEVELIKATMEEINKEFRGIELAVIDPASKSGGIKGALASLLLSDRTGMTVVGPASIVKSIRRDPNKIELLMKEGRKRRR